MDLFEKQSWKEREETLFLCAGSPKGHNSRARPGQGQEPALPPSLPQEWQGRQSMSQSAAARRVDQQGVGQEQRIWDSNQ